MGIALAWLKEHWRLAAWAVSVALAAFLGHSIHPAVRVETRVEVQEKVVERLVEKSSDTKTADEALTVHAHVETTTVTAPDGTKTERRVEDSGLTKTVHEVEVRYIDRTVDRVVEKVVRETQVIESARKNWLVGPMLGVTVLQPGALFGPVEFGAQVQRRIAGPFFVGAYAMHRGTVGVTLSAEF